MTRSRALILYAAVILAGAALDVATKVWVFGALGGRIHDGQLAGLPRVLDLLPGFLDFNLSLNPGAAFSTFIGKTWFLSVFSVAAVVLLTWMIARRESISLPLLLGFSSIGAGAVGNLWDRLHYGVVRDFIHVHWRDAYHYPTFNVADSMISCGVVWLLILEWRRSRQEARQAAPQPHGG